VIRAFGKAGLIATAIAFVTVLLLVPLFGALLVRDEAGFVKKARRADRAVDSLRLACGWIAGRIVSRPGLYTLLGLLAVIGFGSVYEQLQPRYRLADEVPDRGCDCQSCADFPGIESARPFSRFHWKREVRFANS
jgi:hypothetical protein